MSAGHGPSGTLVFIAKNPIHSFTGAVIWSRDRIWTLFEDRRVKARYGVIVNNVTDLDRIATNLAILYKGLTFYRGVEQNRDPLPAIRAGKEVLHSKLATTLRHMRCLVPLVLILQTILRPGNRSRRAGSIGRLQSMHFP
jgi:hypothetical protein